MGMDIDKKRIQCSGRKAIQQNKISILTAKMALIVNGSVNGRNLRHSKYLFGISFVLLIICEGTIVHHILDIEVAIAMKRTGTPTIVESIIIIERTISSFLKNDAKAL